MGWGGARFTIIKVSFDTANECGVLLAISSSLLCLNNNSYVTKSKENWIFWGFGFESRLSANGSWRIPTMHYLPI